MLKPIVIGSAAFTSGAAQTKSTATSIASQALPIGEPPSVAQSEKSPRSIVQLSVIPRVGYVPCHRRKCRGGAFALFRQTPWFRAAVFSGDADPLWPL